MSASYRLIKSRWSKTVIHDRPYNSLSLQRCYSARCTRKRWKVLRTTRFAFHVCDGFGDCIIVTSRKHVLWRPFDRLSGRFWGSWVGSMLFSRHWEGNHNSFVVETDSQGFYRLAWSLSIIHAIIAERINGVLLVKMVKALDTWNNKFVPLKAADNFNQIGCIEHLGF